MSVYPAIASTLVLDGKMQVLYLDFPILVFNSRTPSEQEDSPMSHNLRSTTYCALNIILTEKLCVHLVFCYLVTDGTFLTDLRIYYSKLYLFSGIIDFLNTFLEIVPYFLFLV